MYNTSDLVLEWEEHSPISFDPEMRMTEYTLANFWHNKSNVVSDEVNLRHGAFSRFYWRINYVPYPDLFSASSAVGNYSSLSFTVSLHREIGFYLLDYYLPSIMIVAISWVSFWLQADASPPRIMLGKLKCRKD